MNATVNSVRPLHIGDVNQLISSGVFEGSRKTVEDRIRKIVSDGTSVALRSDDYSIAGVYEKADSSLLSIFSSGDVTVNDLVSFLDQTLRKAFFEDDVYKISVKIPSADKRLEEALTVSGFIQEAVLHREFLIDGRREDGGLFYMILPEYPRSNCVFVPFQRGILAVRGGMDYVEKVDFLSYEKEPGDRFLSQYASYQGLTDDEGLILKRGSFESDYDPSEYDFMPAELMRAYMELKEYFLKKRTSFDINLRVNDATEFQRSVWEKICRIPYGMTVSYEDIALELTGNDISKARKLTRAVGTACSDNPVPVIVPCHRVIGKNGRLTGFSGGIEFKDFLLQNELFATALPLN